MESIVFQITAIVPKMEGDGGYAVIPRITTCQARNVLQVAPAHGRVVVRCHKTHSMLGTIIVTMVVVGVFLDFLHEVAPVGQFGIVGTDGIEELALLLLREGWRLALEGVEEDGGLEFHVVEIRETEKGIGKTESVERAHVAEASDLADVTDVGSTSVPSSVRGMDSPKSASEITTEVSVQRVNS